MLLGAAQYLAETRRFDGTVVLIFQPAEENEGGGRVMVQEGLFERFPVQAVYGLHNWPGLAEGRFAVRPGSTPTYPPPMGAEDFAYMLQARPGAYGWIGNGPGTGGCLLHNPRYDLNDALLAIGASYWATSCGTPKPAGFRSPAEPCKPTAPAKHHRAPAATGSPRQDGQHLRRCRRSGPSPRCAARAVPENRAPGWG